MRPSVKIDSDVEMFIPQTNGEISDSITQNWTRQAWECYCINCDCSKCSIKRSNYSFVCQMPKIVKALLKYRGKPSFNLIADFLTQN